MTKYNVSQKVPRPGSETVRLDPRKVKIILEQIETDKNGNKVVERELSRLESCADNPLNSFKDKNFLCFSGSDKFDFHVRGKAFSENSHSFRIKVDPCFSTDGSCDTRSKVKSFFYSSIMVVYAVDQKMQYSKDLKLHTDFTKQFKPAVIMQVNPNYSQLALVSLR